MNKRNAQKTVLLLLAAALLVQYANLSKLTKIWQLAFNISPVTGPAPTEPPCGPGTFEFNLYCYPNGIKSFPAGPHQSCPPGYSYNAGFCVLNQ